MFCFSKTGKLVLADNTYNKVILLNEDGEKEIDIPTSSGQWDVTVITNNLIAVSTNRGVDIINVYTNTIERFINTGSHGFHHHRGSGVPVNEHYM